MSANRRRRLRRCGTAATSCVRFSIMCVRWSRPGLRPWIWSAPPRRKSRELGRQAGVQGILRLSLRAVHVGERRDCARHPVGKAGAEGRRHRFDRLRRGARRLLRRRGDHGSGGRCGEAGVAEAADGDRGVAATAASSRRGSATRLAMSERRCRSTWKPPDSAWCASSWGMALGRSLHEEPQVPNFGARGHGAKLREGMVIAIEPMVNYGKPETRVLGDKWTAVRSTAVSARTSSTA